MLVVVCVLMFSVWVWSAVQSAVSGHTLAGTTILTNGLLLGRSEVLRCLRHYPGAQSQGHHTIDRLEERGVEIGSASRSSMKGREGRRKSDKH